MRLVTLEAVVKVIRDMDLVAQTRTTGQVLQQGLRSLAVSNKTTVEAWQQSVAEEVW